MTMSHDSSHRDEKRTPDGDLFASGSPIQRAPVAQYTATRSLSDRAPFATALSGYDPDRVSGSDYPWCVP